MVDGVAKKDYVASKTVLTSIYEKIQELNLTVIDFEMTSSTLTATDEIINIRPCTYYEIYFTLNGDTYKIIGDATAFNYADSNNKARSFRDFIKFIKETMESTDEYKSLPKSQGGYD